MTLDSFDPRRPARASGPPGCLPASSCSLETLTAVYNATRVDYLVPMPMSVESMRRYVARYDVDLDASVVMVDDGEAAGLALLGVRGAQGWVTRLGIVPEKRRRASGRRLVATLVEIARERGLERLELEVIRENRAGRRLFSRAGFRSMRELAVSSCEAGPLAGVRSVGDVAVSSLERAELAGRLAAREPEIPWLIQTASFLNMTRLRGLRVVDEEGSEGWLAFRVGSDGIDHIVLGAAAKTDRRLGLALLARLHTDHPGTRVRVQNVPVHDPSVSVFRRAGYTDDFRRIEMRMDLATGAPERVTPESRGNPR